MKFMILVLSSSIFCLWFLGYIWLSLNFAQEQGFVYDENQRRNPFIPLVTPDGRILRLDKEEGSNGLKLEGIVYDEHGLSYAIVNGDVVKTGDMSGDYQVLKIEKNKIKFIKDGEVQEIELKKEGP